MNKDKEQAKLDRAVKAMFNLGSVPDDVDDEKPTRKDKNRRYRMKIRKGKSKIVEVE